MRYSCNDVIVIMTLPLFFCNDNNVTTFHNGNGNVEIRKVIFLNNSLSLPLLIEKNNSLLYLLLVTF